MTLEEYLEHLLAGEDELCLAEGRARAVDLDGLRSLYLDLITPSQYRVGELWEAGIVSVAKEHQATTINRYVATSCYAPLAQATIGGPRGLVNCTSGELHDLGPRIFSDLLECDGWDIDFHAEALELEDLIDAINEVRPRFVGLSTALVLHLGAVKATIAGVRSALGSAAPPVIVGGNAYRSDVDLWREVGADLHAPDAAAAVHLLRSLKP